MDAHGRRAPLCFTTLLIALVTLTSKQALSHPVVLSTATAESLAESMFAFPLSLPPHTGNSDLQLVVFFAVSAVNETTALPAIDEVSFGAYTLQSVESSSFGGAGLVVFGTEYGEDVHLAGGTNVTVGLSSATGNVAAFALIMSVPTEQFREAVVSQGVFNDSAILQVSSPDHNTRAMLAVSFLSIKAASATQLTPINSAILSNTSALNTFGALSSTMVLANSSIEVGFSWNTTEPNTPALMYTIFFSNVSVCDSGPCANGGVCYDADSEVTCLCPSETTGEYCDEYIDRCESSPCTNDGTCHNLQTGGYSCECDYAYFMGDHCEITLDDCTVNPCENGASCTPLGGLGDGLICDCLLGFSGFYCSIGFSFCLLHTCVNGGSCNLLSGLCECPVGYTGFGCLQLDYPTLCANCPPTSTCIAYTPDDVSCVCPFRYYGDDCLNTTACFDDPCSGEAYCVDVDKELQTFECSCPYPHYSELCENTTACYDEPCLNMGTCVDLDIHMRLYECTCPLDFEGAHCENTKSLDAIATELVANATLENDGVVVVNAIANATFTAESFAPYVALVANVTLGADTTLSPELANGVIDVLNVIFDTGATDDNSSSVIDMHSMINSSAIDNLVNIFSSLLSSSTSVQTALKSSSTKKSPAVALERMSERLLGSNMSECSRTMELVDPNNVVRLTGRLVSTSSLANNRSWVAGATSFAVSPEIASASSFVSTNCTRLIINVMRGAAFFAGTDGNDANIVSSIMTATFSDLSLPNPLPSNATVNLTLPLDASAQSASLAQLRCVAWNFTSRVWSEDGCVLVSRDGSDVTCRCNHMTNFAILFDVNGDAAQSTAINVVTYFASAIYIGGCASVVFVYCVLHRLVTRPLALVVICCAASLLSALLYLVNYIASDSISSSGCYALGLVYHYVLLAQLTALGCIGLAFDILLFHARLLTSRDMRRIVLAVLLLPLVIIGVYLAILASLPSTSISSAYTHRNGGLCFLPSTDRLWALVGAPLLVMITLNAVLYCRIVHSLHTFQTRLSESARESRLNASLSLFVLLGLTWVFGVLSIGVSHVSMQYAHYLMMAATGVFMAVAYAFSPTMRKGLRDLWRSAHSSSSSNANKRHRRDAQPVPLNSPVLARKSSLARRTMAVLTNGRVRVADVHARMPGNPLGLASASTASTLSTDPSLLTMAMSPGAGSRGTQLHQLPLLIDHVYDPTEKRYVPVSSPLSTPIAVQRSAHRRKKEVPAAAVAMTVGNVPVLTIEADANTQWVCNDDEPSQHLGPLAEQSRHEEAQQQKAKRALSPKTHSSSAHDWTKARYQSSIYSIASVETTVSLAGDRGSYNPHKQAVDGVAGAPQHWTCEVAGADADDDDDGFDMDDDTDKAHDAITMTVLNPRRLSFTEDEPIS